MGRIIPPHKRHEKQRSKLELALHQRGFDDALRAMEFVRDLEHGAVRKDGQTPKFHHQVSVARLCYTLLPHLKYPEPTIAAAFLHDVTEDYGIGQMALAGQFGWRISDAVWKLTKKWGSTVKEYENYFSELATCPIASIVKLADRAHNIQTMQGVFGELKQRAYVEEVSEWFFPLIREARRRHPTQYDAYENLKILLRCQVDLLRHMLREDPE